MNIGQQESQDQTNGRALVNKIIEFRKEISELINTFGPGSLIPSREISLAKTDAQRSFHHLGLQLKMMNEKNPYPETSNPDSKVIEPNPDAVNSVVSLDGETQLERVKQLRLHVQKIIDKYDNAGYPLSYEMRHYHKSQDWLIEVKMWLGWELGRIRDQRTEDQNPNTEEGPNSRLDINLY